MKFDSVVAIPFLSETWTITGKEKQHIQTAETVSYTHLDVYKRQYLNILFSMKYIYIKIIFFIPGTGVAYLCCNIMPLL